MRARLDEVAEWLQESSLTTVLTGAGISTDSGIPDYRGPQGLWTKDPEAEKLSNIHYYMSYPEIRAKAWQARLRHPALGATPNPGHIALAELERLDRLQLLITQNVDGLHTKAGNSADRVVEMHGTIHEVVCMACGDRSAMEAILGRVKAGEEDPPCVRCGGILKSATVSFGQSLSQDDIERAVNAAVRSKVFLCAGTSLGVYPVAELPALAIDAGARLVIMNAEPTPYDLHADAVFSEPLSVILPKLVEMVSQ